MIHDSSTLFCEIGLLGLFYARPMAFTLSVIALDVSSVRSVKEPNSIQTILPPLGFFKGGSLGQMLSLYPNSNVKHMTARSTVRQSEQQPSALTRNTMSCNVLCAAPLERFVHEPLEFQRLPHQRNSGDVVSRR